MPLDVSARTNSDSLSETVCDIQSNWSRASKCHNVKRDELSDKKIDDDLVVFLPVSSDEDIAGIQNWIKENIKKPKSVSVYLRYAWSQGRFSTSKRFMGLTFSFKDVNDFMFFKLYWTANSLSSFFLNMFIIRRICIVFLSRFGVEFV